MKLIIIDDQRILAEGLKLLLSQEADIDVLAIGENGQEAVALVEALKSGLGVDGHTNAHMNGVEAIRRIKETHPEVHCLILTTFSDDAYI